MSFILEALKKSEQQRQEQNATQQVRKRTLSLQAHRPERRLVPWLLAGLVPLLLLGGWWLYSETAPFPEQAADVLPVAGTPAVTNPAPLASPQQLPVAAAEPAPVPSAYVAPVQRNETAGQSQQVDARSVAEVTKVDEEVAAEERVAQVVDPLPIESQAGQVPRYLDLPRGLRERMPALFMSMHFYNKSPDRRLVRINDRLLREGDWVSSDLELVAITPTGVIFDFLGKSFELPGSNR